MASNLGLFSLVLAVLTTTQSAVITASITTSAGPSEISSSTLKLARSYTGSDFLNDFEFFTTDDPTQGYVK